MLCRGHLGLRFVHISAETFPAAPAVCASNLGDAFGNVAWVRKVSRWMLHAISMLVFAQCHQGGRSCCLNF